MWKIIDEYPSYEVSTEGEVRNAKTKRCLTPSPSAAGYLRVNLRKNNQTYSAYVHRLVAITFLDNPLALSEVHHIDENKQNNCLENLQWISHRDNINAGSCIVRRSKNRGYKVRCIETGIIYETQKAASIALGLNEGAVKDVFRGKTRTAGGFHWERIL